MMTKARMKQFFTAKKNDVTIALVDAFVPDEKQRRSVIEILDKESVPVSDLQ